MRRNYFKGLLEVAVFICIQLSMSFAFAESFYGQRRGDYENFPDQTPEDLVTGATSLEQMCIDVRRITEQLGGVLSLKIDGQYLSAIKMYSAQAAGYLHSQSEHSSLAISYARQVVDCMEVAEPYVRQLMGGEKMALEAARWYRLKGYIEADLGYKGKASHCSANRKSRM